MVRRIDEGLSNSMETKLEDFAQEYGGIDYNDIGKLSNCWDSLDATTKKNIQKLVSTVRKACKEAGMDAGELANEYPEDKKTCDDLVKAIKSASKKCSKKESVGRRRLIEKKWNLSIPDSVSGPMREAIAMEEYMDVATGLRACWEFIHNSIPDQYDEFDFDSDCAQIDDIIEQLEEDEYADVEDDLDYLLNEFYDFCDNMNIWVGGL